MTTQTLQPRHHLSGRRAALAVAGVGLVVAAAVGTTAWVSDNGRLTLPAQDPHSAVNTEGARDSWEGRIGPDAKPRPEPGVRDSWMPPGVTDQQLRLKLEQLR